MVDVARQILQKLLFVEIIQTVAVTVNSTPKRLQSFATHCTGLPELLAQDTERFHLKIQCVTSRWPRICPNAPLMLAIVIELRTLLIGMFRPSLQFPVSVTFCLFAFPPELLKFRLLVLLGKVATSEIDNALVRIPMQLFQRVRPRAGVSLHIVIEDAISTVVMLRPLRGKRCVESLIRNPHQIVIYNWVDAKIPSICNELGFRGFETPLSGPLGACHELIYSQRALHAMR
jgi:hypothetical protein